MLWSGYPTSSCTGGDSYYGQGMFVGSTDDLEKVIRDEDIVVPSLVRVSALRA
jgi:hypothetical protein